MRKLLSTLFLMTLFVSCSTERDELDSSHEGNNGGQNKPVIDERLIGNWGVSYFKRIRPATYNKTTGLPEYDASASILEYTILPDQIPHTIEGGIFSGNESIVSFRRDGTIVITQRVGGHSYGDQVDYTIENGLLVTDGKWTSPSDNSGIYEPKKFHRYSVDNAKRTLTVEFIGTEDYVSWIPFYKASTYTKMDY